MTPNGRENEEEFDKDGAKWQNASHKDGEDGTHVPHLFGDLTRNLVSSDRLLHWLENNQAVIE